MNQMWIEGGGTLLEWAEILILPWDNEKPMLRYEQYHPDPT